MRHNSIASEYVPHFFVKLKKRRFEKWYVNKMQLDKKCRKYFNESDYQKTLEIDQIGFCKKHFWYHFNTNSVDGWIPIKFIRKNYHVLVLPKLDGNMFSRLDVATLWLLIKFSFVKSCPQELRIEILNADESFDLRKSILKYIGSYKDLTNKSFRCVKSQISRNRLVILQHRTTGQYLILYGFQRRVFFYLDISKQVNRKITVSQLSHLWKSNQYMAFSY
jgi:hypothetical protein